MYPLLNSALTYTPANGTYKAPNRPTHLGHDITPIVKPTNLKALSVLPGKVIYAAKGAGLNGTQETIVIIQHANEWSAYGHLKHDSLLVKAGQQVGEYQPLATIGYTGFTQPAGVGGTHLHIQVGKGKFNDNLGNSPTTNPLPYLLQGGPPMSELDELTVRRAVEGEYLAHTGKLPPQTIINQKVAYCMEHNGFGQFFSDIHNDEANSCPPDVIADAKKYREAQTVTLKVVK